MPPARDLDLLVFGATGFTGKLVAEHLARSYSTGPNKVRYALAGRDASRLEAARAQVAEFAPLAAEAELVAVDPSDHDALVRVFGRSKVVLSTAGPYQLYGTPIVKAAVVSFEFFSPFFSSFGLFLQRGQTEEEGLIIHLFSFKPTPSLKNRTPARTTATARASSRG